MVVFVCFGIPCRRELDPACSQVSFRTVISLAGYQLFGLATIVKMNGNLELIMT